MRRAGTGFAGVVALAMVMATVAAPAWAQAPTATTKGQVNEFMGSFSTGVPIQVPAYRGLEPGLALTYSSAGGNGFAGAGWSLSGFSSIERASPGRGAPHYVDAPTTTCDTCYQTCFQTCYQYCDKYGCRACTGPTTCTSYDKFGNCTSTAACSAYDCNPYNCNGYNCNCATVPADVFLLDGEELVPCAAGSVSPSCTTGGTHSTKRESYLKIQKASATTWYVWRKDGRRATYSALFTTTKGTFRWAQTEIRDLNNNVVTFAWSCVGSPHQDCYPASVSYNGTVVTLYREARTDTNTFATGAGLGTTGYRLKSIDVKVNGSRARAYQLTYSTSGSTSRSLLTSVRLYGKDSTVSSAGAVSGGSALPASSLSMSGNAVGFGTYVAGPGWSDASGWGVDKYYSTIRYPDLNGDGKADVCGRSAAGVGCYLGTGSGFSSALSGPAYSDAGGWGSPQYYSTISYPDLNGDGKADICARNSVRVQCYLGTGTGFTTSVTGPAWSDAAGWAAVARYSTISYPDLNGDGKADICGRSGTGIECHLSTGTAFGPAIVGPAWSDANAWNNAQYYSTISYPDLNGDGKADICARDSLGVTCYLGTGAGFISTFRGPAFTDAGGWANAKYYSTISYPDLDGDGRADLCARHSVSITCYRGTGASFTANFGGPGWSDASGWGGVPYYSSITYADFDGDGKADICARSGAGVLGYRTATGAELLTTVANGFGGTTTIAYLPSTSWATAHVDSTCVASPPTVYCPNNPPVANLVSTVTVTDGRGGSATTAYAYSGGLYDRQDRRPLGFRYVKETAPCLTSDGGGCTTQGAAVSGTSPYEETWYRQDYGSVSKPARVDVRKGNGVLLAATVHDYTTNGATVPYTSVETGTWEHVYDGTGGTACPGANCKRTYLGRAYDGYGNVTLQQLYGECSSTTQACGTTGDETTVQFVFRPKTSSYIVDKPAVINAFAGIGTGGTLLTQVLVTYDGNSTWDAAPTVGKVKSMAQWLDVPSSFVFKTFTYDSAGSLLSEADALGATRWYAYDVSGRMVSTTNALGQMATSTWDSLCSVETGGTDLNGQTNTTTLDALCRVTRRDGPGGLFELRTYNNLGSPTTQYVESQTNAADGGSNYWAREYRDGLGRTYRRQAKGPSTGSDIFVDVTYTARGKEAGRTAPYYTGATPQWTSLAYDAVDRVTRMTAADGTFTSASYGLWSVTRTDELGHVSDELADAFGRLVRQREKKSDGTWVTATHQYNLRGERVKLTDGGGHQRTWGYDSLGRKTSMTDPNAGSWSYGYDAAGHLTLQTDAKLQRTELSYDLLGRRTKKVAKRADGTVEATVTWTFDQSRSGYYNRGQLTTMVDPSGTATYDYDAGGRPVKVSRTVDGTAYTVTRGFDAAGRLLSMTFPDGDTVGTTAVPLRYDAVGRTTLIPNLVTGALYDAAGRLTKQTNANGTVTTRSYSATRGWVTGVTTVKGGTTLQNLAYSYDNDGRVTKVTSAFANEGWSYAYDALHQLTAATNLSSSTYNQTWAFATNGNGNVTTKSRLGSYAYGTKPHAVTTAGANTYAYDANGNMVSGAGRTITWNTDNLPANVSGATFTYDGNGSRLKKVAVGGAQTLYLGDDYQVTAGVATKYVALAGVLVAKRVGTTSSWLHTDNHGSIQLVTDVNGLEVQRLKYRPDGDRLSTGTTHVESRGFAGQRQDESGLFYLHARYYDPLLGRFISPDPVLDTRTVGDMNGYSYAGNDPANALDVDGQFSLKKAFKKVTHAFKKVGSAVLKLAGGVISAVAVLPVTLVAGGLSPGHMGRFITQGGFFTAAGRDEFTAAMMNIAVGLNRIPMVGGLLALPFVSMGQAAQGDFGAALRSAATFVIAVAAIVAAVCTGQAANPGFWPGFVAAMQSFAIGFTAGFAIGVVNGVNASRAFYTGMAFGMFCASISSLVHGVGTWAESGWLGKGFTSFQVASLSTSIARSVTGPKEQRFDYRFDYVGHAGVGGNVMGGPLNGNTPWNYNSYLHDMAGMKEGYSEYYGKKIFPMPLTTDVGVWGRSYTGWSW